MTNRRKQPQRVPPPLLAGNERLEGEWILDEFPGETGLLLWKTFRGVKLWTELSAPERDELVSDAAYQARLSHLDLTGEVDEIAEPLSVLADMHRKRLAASSVVSRCRAIEEWADRRNKGRTALEFGQLAAIAAPNDAPAAVSVAKRGRDMAEYARAESWYWQAVVRARRSGDWEAYVRAMLGMGVTHRLRGNYPAARRNMVRGLRRARRQALGPMIPMAYHELTVLAIKGDNLRRTVKYGRRTLEGYGPDHPRLPILANDVAIFWMNRGYFREGYALICSVPERASLAENVLVSANRARAAGALGRVAEFQSLAQVVESSYRETAVGSVAASALLDTARGALSLGLVHSASDLATESLALARRRREAEIVFEAEAVLGECNALSTHSVTTVSRKVTPEPVAAFTTELTQALVAAAPAA